ncbi:MAG TPA: glycosyltransferase, partial [Anaeromyxobacteraceae bacterium]|nr:glycosyltransferase [Anaeromyxobacteraceae bacterium]
MAPPRRLRIAFAADLVGGLKTGGVVSAARFVEALRRDHDVTVLATGPGADGPGRLPPFYVPPFGRVMKEMGFVFAWPRRATLEEVIGRADVLHVQFPFWLGVRATAVARRLGTPIVAASHIQPENLLLNVGLRSAPLADRVWRLFLRTVYARADAVVCPSEFARGELQRRGLAVPALVVSNGIGPAFRPGPAERPARHQGRFLVLAVGRQAPEKRLDLVVEGVRRSRHAARVQLVVTGRGPEEARVRRLAATLPLPAEVTFVSDEELLRLLRTADLLVHASEVELEGMAVLEALGCGTPALVADAPGSAARHLAVGDDLRFRAGDADDLARRLDALVEAPARLAAARARCLELAAGLSLDESVRRLAAVYERVARPPP